MRRLGYSRYLVQGGDWGAMIGKMISLIYEENVMGVHMLGNWDAMSVGESPSQLCKTIAAAYFPRFIFSASDNWEREYSKLFPFGEKFVRFLSETGYMHIQATKPDTVAAGLVDSPAGLAAYLLEKFSTWTNLDNPNRDDGALTQKFSLDELLTNVMIYWTSRNVAASFRFYKENLSKQSELMSQKISVPAGTVDFPQEMIRTPQILVKANYRNLLQYSDFPRGGHFIAWEEPELVVNDFRALVGKILAFETGKANESDKKNDNHRSARDEM